MKLVSQSLVGRAIGPSWDGDGFQCSNSSATNDYFDDEPLLKKFCVLLCMPQNVHLRTPEIIEFSSGNMCYIYKP